ncbi:uncharacterized protein HKW66_Vig0071070 [Vigna angularis]|uniref:Pectinesterase inhibitor domain-containing protein n=3 Tax=Phaseolus angularis TaxID=3914 RepID=A0A8T0K6Y2_PHAAN|nr:uncharacterized protein LOC108342781 [Vigna angularis]KAG2395517.1 uncharacterized protein HKW66_Vig0071070 [Vigna angularis]
MEMPKMGGRDALYIRRCGCVYSKKTQVPYLSPFVSDLQTSFSREETMDFIPKTSFILLVTLSFLLLTKPVLSSRDIHIVQREIQEDINQLCQKTTDPALCANTIKPHFAQNKLSAIKALDVEVEATLAEAKTALGKIQTLENKKDNTKSTKDSLDVCDDQYNSMLDAIEETKQAIAKNDVTTAKFKFSAVISYHSACRDTFKGGVTPFDKDSNAVYKLGGIALDIIADIEKSLPPPRSTPTQSAPSAFSSVIGTVS